jgi:hypothetical protein
LPWLLVAGATTVMMLRAPAFFLEPRFWAEEGRIDRSRKMRIYAREGVAHLWSVDPLARTLEVYRLEGGRWVVASAHGGDDVVRAEPFGALAIDIGRWWLEEAAPGAAPG